jgi:predicted RNase H-like nuclease (RuvC/YqgF family)
MSLFDDVKKNLMEWYSITSEKTTEVARLTTRKYDKFGISRDIERQFSELGSLVYIGMKEGRRDLFDDPGVTALVARIEGLEAELKAKNEEIEEIKRQYAERKAAAAGSAAGAGVATETIIKDPELEQGTGESAILVEPADASQAGESSHKGGGAEETEPRNEG